MAPFSVLVLEQIDGLTSSESGRRLLCTLGVFLDDTSESIDASYFSLIIFLSLSSCDLGANKSFRRIACLHSSSGTFVVVDFVDVAERNRA